MAHQYWFLTGKTILLMGMATTVLRWFLPSMPSDLASVFYIVAFAMNLASEKIVGKPLPSSEKAFCNFAIYLFVFFILEHRVRDLVGPNLTARFILGFTFAMATLIIYQIRLLKRLSRNTAESNWSLIWGLIAIAGMGSVVIVYFREGFYF